MIKAYTDIEQSRKLAEILSADSADMLYIMYRNGAKPQNGDANLSTVYESNDHKWYWIDIIDDSWDMRIGEDIPCWSLASLIGIIRKRTGYTIYGVCDVYMSCELGDFKKIETKVHDNEVDACVEMIIKLHEQNLL